MVWLLLIPGLVLLGLVLYWQLIVTEGTYLGPRVVTLLYDWSAGIYERIKRYDVGAEQWFLGIPLLLAFEWIDAPLVLDVATGTGRLPRALLRQETFDGHVIGLDLSRRMLRKAVHETAQFAGQLTYIWQDARQLPFQDDTFDAVTCLEALEFTPDARQVLAELVRVLRPSGVLLVTNRIGRDARFMPGRVFPRDQFAHALGEFALEDIRVRAWQMDYDLGWAVKSGRPGGGGVRPLPDIMRCPACGGDVEAVERAFRCTACTRRYPIAGDSVIEVARSASRKPPG